MALAGKLYFKGQTFAYSTQILLGSKVEIPKPMTFRPTMEEFGNLQEYMGSVEAQVKLTLLG